MPKALGKKTKAPIHLLLPLSPGRLRQPIMSRGLRPGC